MGHLELTVVVSPLIAVPVALLLYGAAAGGGDDPRARATAHTAVGGR